MENKILQFLS